MLLCPLEQSTGIFILKAALKQPQDFKWQSANWLG